VSNGVVGLATGRLGDTPFAVGLCAVALSHSIDGVEADADGVAVVVSDTTNPAGLVVWPLSDARCGSEAAAATMQRAIPVATPPATEGDDGVLWSVDVSYPQLGDAAAPDAVVCGCVVATSWGLQCVAADGDGATSVVFAAAWDVVPGAALCHREGDADGKQFAVAVCNSASGAAIHIVAVPAGGTAVTSRAAAARRLIVLCSRDRPSMRGSALVCVALAPPPQEAITTGSIAEVLLSKRPELSTHTAWPHVLPMR
jgi:hypothetical protein